MKDLRDMMHLQLARHGIVIETTQVKRREAPPQPSVASAPLDRGRIRRILIERGAPERSLRWLTISCPSYEAAMGYRPPGET